MNSADIMQLIHATRKIGGSPDVVKMHAVDYKSILREIAGEESGKQGKLYSISGVQVEIDNECPIGQIFVMQKQESKA